MKLGIGILLIVMTVIPHAVLAQDNSDGFPQTATGFLQKSLDPNIYLLTDEDGKPWDLRSETVPLGSHVGHIVKVTGTIPKVSKDSADTAPQNHLVVTKLEMIRDTVSFDNFSVRGAGPVVASSDGERAGARARATTGVPHRGQGLPARP